MAQGCHEYVSDGLELLAGIYVNISRKYRQQLSRYNISCLDNVTDAADDDGILDTYADFLENHNTQGSDHSDDFSYLFYAYMTPLIFVIGLAGNAASLAIFLSRELRRYNASLYLTALTLFDTLVLLTYVLLGWLHDGLPFWPGNYQLSIIHTQVVCPAFLFTSYMSRFCSVYVMLAFTVERFIAIWMPLRSKILCTRKFAFKLILLSFVTGCLASLYKPLLSGMYDPQLSMSLTTATTNSGEKFCLRNAKYDDVTLVFETLYGVLIMGIPFVLMLTFNTLILYRLVHRPAYLQSPAQSKSRDTKVRREFTVISFSISSCFIATNLPYFVVWVLLFRSSQQTDAHLHYVEHLKALKRITQTVFYVNYCANFFIYCLTGANYRRVLRRWCRCCQRRDVTRGAAGGDDTMNNGYTAVRLASNMSHTQQDYL